MRRVSILLAIAVIAVPLATASAAPRRTGVKRLPALTSVADDALSSALEKGRVSSAEYALERARSVFELGDVRADFGAVARPHPRAATLIFRDLALRVGQLGGEERAEAEAILARPDSGGGSADIGEPYAPTAVRGTPVCSTNVCIHYVRDTADAPADTDTNANSVPDWVDLTSTVMEEVWTAEITQMGWRAPKSDLSSSNHGPDGKLDIYITNLGDDGAYGYCTTDDPARQTTFDVSTYCVLDNNYTESVFGVTRGEMALRVTAAHEFNHASQWAYDWTEDPWLLEATATWMEDEVYDDINDNVQYLDSSPIADPHLPLDTHYPFSYSGDNASFSYGSWIFIRYLSETYGDDLIIDIFERADGAAGAPDDPSIRAVSNALAMPLYATSLSQVYRDFTAQNVDPSQYYEEGISYPKATRAVTHRLATDTPSVVQTRTLDHLSSQYVTFEPGVGVATDEDLAVRVNLTDEATSPLATLVSVSTAGSLSFTEIVLDSAGKGQAVVDGFGGMREVVLVLGNGSSRFDRTTCFTHRTRYSCGGATFRDENLRFAYSGALGSTGVDPGEPADTNAPRIKNVVDRPDPFRVNGTRIWHLLFTLNEPAHVAVEVRNPAGRRILRLADSVAGNIRIDARWNGVIGRRLAPKGRYKYKIIATDAAKNRRVARGTVTIRR